MTKGISTPIIIGTRGSQLALWQANFTKQVLEQNNYLVELKIIQTKGDTSQQWNTSFEKLEGKGFFTKELEDALLNSEIDLAVHSCKDVPTQQPTGLSITAYSKRANPFDVLLINKNKVDTTQFLQLQQNAIVGTSSARRKTQLLSYRNDIEIKDIRGNVPTRIDKLRKGEFDAIILAQAGIERLEINLNEFEVIVLDAPLFIPAPAQGVLAYQIRENDKELASICSILNDTNSSNLALLERKVLADFEGGCQMPLGAYATTNNGVTKLWIAQAKQWNSFPSRICIENPSLDYNYKHIFNNTANTIFISRDLDADSYLKQSLQDSIIGKSLIDFKAVDFSFNNTYDWLFFCSKRAVDFFFTTVDKNHMSTTKIAALGKATAFHLQQKNINVDFIGDSIGATSAEKFASITKGKVAFPMANNSSMSVQKALANFNHIQTENIIVYSNQPIQNIAQQHENILVFTSPMNAENYFSQFQLLENQQVIAIGKATSTALQQLNITHTVSQTPYEYSIVDEINQLSIIKPI
ncbi:MAG: hydroxymethylbilane synthase [Chitinophagales bacterium]|nr:hydroxymethylbilane synthase [Chitinophagales bacterium]